MFRCLGCGNVFIDKPTNEHCPRCRTYISKSYNNPNVTPPANQLHVHSGNVSTVDHGVFSGNFGKDIYPRITGADV